MMLNNFWSLRNIEFPHFFLNPPKTVHPIAHYTGIRLKLKKVEHLTKKSELYKANKISMNPSDRENFMKPELWLQGIFVRKNFKARAWRNFLEQQSWT